MFKEFFEVYFKPISIRKYARKDFGRALLNILVASAIGGAVSGFFAALFIATLGAYLGAFLPIGFLGMVGITGVSLFFMILLYTIIASILGLIIGSAILFLFAKIFKGKGSYVAQTYAISLPSSAVILISYVVGWIPVLGGIIGILAGLWCLYPLTIVLRETHQYTTGKAVLTWLIPTIIVLVIFIIWMWIVISAVKAGLLAAFLAL